jgi:hypothetical protein
MEEAKKNPEIPEKKILPNGGYPMHSFEDLKELYFTYITSPDDRKMVEDAYHLADEKHKGVLRKSGEPYIHHPIEVAYILAQLQSGPETLASGLLHDTVEDTDLTIEHIRKQFGDDVAMIVDSLTKIQRMKLSHRTESDFEAEDHRKIFLGMAKDVRVILVKLADRLHNMRTLDALIPERQKPFPRKPSTFSPRSPTGLAFTRSKASWRIFPSNTSSLRNTRRSFPFSTKKRPTARTPSTTSRNGSPTCSSRRRSPSGSKAGSNRSTRFTGRCTSKTTISMRSTMFWPSESSPRAR